MQHIMKAVHVIKHYMVKFAKQKNISTVRFLANAACRIMQACHDKIHTHPIFLCDQAQKTSGWLESLFGPRSFLSNVILTIKEAIMPLICISNTF